MRKILERLVKGEIPMDEAEKLIKLSAIERVSNIAKVDIGREFRKGIPEIILATGKSPKETARIAFHCMKKRGRAIVSRADDKCIKAIKEMVKSDADIFINRRSRIIVIKRKDFKLDKTGGKVGIITAGTSDIPIAEEAKIIAEEMGCDVFTAYDVGVAGIHRLFRPLKNMLRKDVDALIVVAGMEGALPSLVAGLVDIPVIGVPSSLSFGFGEKGISALMAMLQACPLGLSVVNIDNGVAAGAFSALIANRVASKKLKS
ncbi:MAG: nickel pincer cofactor biosynthesis protein LarB [archaeon]|nr:nickel pincer cofactor biosynthesis protein LarB [archaeon]MCP8314636.1 nickel pincer cofactor biosynthesis protein LarB [archaeon]MCP8317391.1 nickel pincer cofactor biosynthesis protein LarB [archaeon]MCP8320448.1 nickel pincer cofactor biosynthesis protein LarB [archaeon]